MRALAILLALVALISALAIFLPAQNAIEDLADTIGANVDSETATDTDIPYVLSGKWRLKTPNTAVDLSSFSGEEQVSFTRQGSDYEGLVYSSMRVGTYGESAALYYVCDGQADLSYCDGNYRYSTVTLVGTHSASEAFYEWFTSNFEKVVISADTESTTEPETESETEPQSGTSLSGTWTFKDNVSFSSFPGNTSLSFTANGEEYTSMYVWSMADGTKTLWYGASVSVNALGSSWLEGYQEITFTETQTVSEEFYEWFTANATQN